VPRTVQDGYSEEFEGYEEQALGETPFLLKHIVKFVLLTMNIGVLRAAGKH